MPETESSPPAGLDDFLTRWEASGGAERANYQLFLTDLCDILGVPRPEPTRPDDADNGYVFERSVILHNANGSTSTGWADLYKRGCFVLEAKQGSDKREASVLGMAPKRQRRGTAVRGTSGWDEAMLSAKGQAEQYVRALPSSEPNPPFILVVDVGHTIEVYSDFSRQGRTYVPFPDALTHRIKHRDLAKPETLDLLRLVWTDPFELDPSRHAAKVTKDVADKLAKLAKSLEASGHAAEVVAQFLMRCLFTFFAEDVGLLKPKDGFTNMLRDLRDRRRIDLFRQKTRSLWETMKTGGFSPILENDVLRFNGGLFESADALDLTPDQLALMVDAGEKGWRDVEPAIFGTLLERALSDRDRHKLGAHFTPRAYVERLVIPTIIDPLREQWKDVQAAVVLTVKEAEEAYGEASATRVEKTDREAMRNLTAARVKARGLLRDFLKLLCSTVVLDPACGTGNFLYVAMELMKRLEGEVWEMLKDLGETETFEGFGMRVDPHQFLGIEINPRAAAIADLVLWIGFLQWHFRNTGDKAPAEPIIRAYHNIECRDAVLGYDRMEPLLDATGNPKTRWDGIAKKRHPLTDEEVPDDSVRVPVWKYVNPCKVDWPKADYIVGNPPFIGKRGVRLALGDGYIEALRIAWQEVPESCDYVMYWWHKSAELLKNHKIHQFGLITTNSIRQPFNNRLLDRYFEGDSPIYLSFAIPDAPWVDSSDGADVRISITVARSGSGSGELVEVLGDGYSSDETPALLTRSTWGRIQADLTVGAEIIQASELKSNLGLCAVGFQLNGQGFVVTRDEAISLGLGLDPASDHLIRPLLNGRDIAQQSRDLLAIDLDTLSLNKLIEDYPKIYQWVLQRVKPERDQNSEKSRKEMWWLYGRRNTELRKALTGIKRFIAAPVTSKHRFFTFVNEGTIVDSSSFAIALDDAYHLGILSSRVHVTWALRAGTNLGVGNDPRYNKTRCFEPFPFPIMETTDSRLIRKLSERLDAHRKARQAEDPSLTLTGMYNVLAKLRSGEVLTNKERAIHELGLVSVLKQIHDELDAAVFDAYGWPHDLTDDEILRRLVELNKERAAEEARGLIRWLRPEFQNPGGPKAPEARQGQFIEDEPEAATIGTPATKLPWPKTLPEQAQAVRGLLATASAPLTPAALAKMFKGANKDRVVVLLDTLASLGHARALDDGTFVRS